MVKLVRYMVLLCLELNIWIKVKHIPGSSNVIADALSFSVQQVPRIGSVGGRCRRGVSSPPVGIDLVLIWSLLQRSVAGSTWSSYAGAWEE